MKLSKTKKIILLGASIGILTTMIVTPIVLLNTNENNQDEQNQKDVESVVKILEEKNQNERILKFASSLTGKIVVNNQTKIVAKIKTLIGETNLKGVKIEILMKNDQNISPNYAKIEIKVSKGKYSKMVDSKKPYFVIREQNQQEIITDVNSVKIALTKLATKTLELKAKVDDKTINANKNAILDTLKQVEGYLEIKFKKVKIEVKENSSQLPSHSATPINIVFVLSKGSYNSELTGFSAKQLAPNQVNEIERELNELKSSLENLETKEVEVYAPNTNKTITHNKVAIKSAIENLDGYDEIDLSGVSLEVKNSNDNLPTNDQPATSIILVLSKKNVDVEVQGFSAKQSLTMTPQDKINQIKEKITDKDILIAPNVSTQNQSEIQSAIKNQLQKENPFLNNDDLAKISTNVSSLILGTRVEVILTISIDSNSLPLSIYVEKINLLKNSNIVSGYSGTIFQDDFGNLWAMGNIQKLQVLKANQNGDGYSNIGWINDNSITGDNLLKNSNINDGFSGKIFQDKFKNLWTISLNQRLQVLKVNQNGDGYVNTGWINDNSSSGDNLLKNSNITNGFNGTIFQDDFKNLWSMGKDQKLQVLKASQNGDGYVNTGWINDNSITGDNLLKNSNITNGSNGTIFQDDFKNLWSMGKDQKLQVLKANQNSDGYVNTGWINDNSSSGDNLLKNSNITDGSDGTIFQDSFKNLWAMGDDQRLQVLKANQNGDGYVNTGWINDNSSSGDNLLKNSNVFNGRFGTIFQDEFKNLWVIGIPRKVQIRNFQVLKVNSSKDGYVNTGWTNATNNRLLNGSNIFDKGGEGIATIFQDSFKNLWAMSRGTSLQVLKANQNGNDYVNTGWTNTNSKLTRDLNISNGEFGTIFKINLKTFEQWVLQQQKLLKNIQKPFIQNSKFLK